MLSDIPKASYGVYRECKNSSNLSFIEEQVRRLGYAVLDPGFSIEKIKKISSVFNASRCRYIEEYGEDYLKGIDEYNTIRSPLTYGGSEFVELALEESLLAVVGRLISGKFILNQQNGIVNPAGEEYNQGLWHRDLPYQHFISSQPIAINAIYCVDDFTRENGATFVLPASHKSEVFPSEKFISNNACQIEVKAGSFIILDCMLYHAGGSNISRSDRRGINHMYNIPFMKQQISIPGNIISDSLSDNDKYILGFGSVEPSSVSSYLKSR